MEEENKFDKNGNLIIRLTTDDSALIVRADGTVELVSHDLENSEDGYLGDIEDLNKTFTLVLALASALENEDLYNRIFHNLNMVLMKKWDSMPDHVRKQIIEKRTRLDKSRTKEQEEEKIRRMRDFRQRMNKYKESFLDDLENEKRRLMRDLQDEENFHNKHAEFGDMGPLESMMEEQIDEYEQMKKKHPKLKKKKLNPLTDLQGIDWNPYDETLKANLKGKWREDHPPEEE
tara:strand:- start:1416 stop:2111 length:696 start_codon:yes stop_codon:yes gene_type:complete